MNLHGPCSSCGKPVSCLDATNSTQKWMPYNAWLVCPLCWITYKESEYCSYHAFSAPAEVLKLSTLRCTSCAEEKGGVVLDLVVLKKEKGLHVAPGFAHLSDIKDLRLLTSYHPSTVVGWKPNTPVMLEKHFLVVVDPKKLCHCNRCALKTGHIPEEEVA